MYLCLSCLERFEIPDKIKEPDGLDTPPYRYSGICPSCGSDDYDEIVSMCNGCGKYVVVSDTYYKTPDGALYCSDCIEVFN